MKISSNNLSKAKPIKYLLISILASFVTSSIFAQNIHSCTLEKSVEDYLRCTIEDHYKDETFYPKPPFLTDSVITGTKQDMLRADSVKYYLDSITNQRHKSFYKFIEEGFNYFFKEDCFYTLLALSVHRDVNVRIEAIKKLNYLIKVSMVRNDQKLKSGQRFKEYKDAKRFLIYVLENTPWRITGSENATIHRIYTENIMNALYLLFAEKRPYNDSQIYIFTEKEIQNNIDRWKEQLK